MIPFYGLSKQSNSLREELLHHTASVLDTGIYLSGNYTSVLEKWLTEKTKCKYAVTMNNGTQALEVIASYVSTVHVQRYNLITPTIYLPNLTYPATLNAFVFSNKSSPDAKIFDIVIRDTDSIGIMPKVQKEGDKFEYACYVGLYGAPVPKRLNRLFDIVDGAQHWLNSDGNIGLAMAISFDPTKNLPASGNGGAIITDNKQLYEYAMVYKNNCINQAQYSCAFPIAGTNSKMSEIDCAHVLVRSKYIDEWQTRRKQINDYYLQEFTDLPVECLSRGIENHTHHKFVISSMSYDRGDFRQFLFDHGIETKIHYTTTISSCYIAKTHSIPLDFLNKSTMLASSVVSLPIYPELTDTEIEFIAKKVKEYFSR